MLVGHCAVALAGKRVTPTVSLGTLLVAALLADLLGIIFILAGVEHWTMRPGMTGVQAVDLDRIVWSHSLLMDVVWAALLATGYFLWKRHSRGAWILFLAVLSHWVLDVVSHRPDMPLAPGLERYLGLGLWTSFPATLLVEGSLWLLALVLYVRLTRSAGRMGLYVFRIVIAFLTLSWIGNVMGTPPSGSLTVAALASLTFFGLLVAWGYWMDRLRPART